MKQFDIWETREIFHGSDIVRRFTFEGINLQVSYALLAVQNRQLAMNLAILREKSAHFQIKDCFECLSPHEIAV